MATAKARLHGEIFRRGVEGTLKPIWSKDKHGNPIKVDEVREWSDKMTELAARAHLPEYSPKIQQEISGPGGAPIQIDSSVQVSIVLPENFRTSIVDTTAEVAQVEDKPADPTSFADDSPEI